MAAASDLKKGRGIPDWAMLAEGPHPAFAVIKAFRELTGQAVDTLTAKEGKSLLTHYAELCQQHQLTPDQMVQAHRVLRGGKWGQWYLENHKWSRGFEQKYVDQLVLAASQIRDGRIQVDEDGEATEEIPLEELAQGTGLKAILAHEALKERRRHTGDGQ
jgi:hypothetical protein